MAEDEEHPPSRNRFMAGMRDPGSGIQFLIAVIGVLLVGVIIGVAMELATPKDGNSNDPNKEPDPNWCGDCVLSRQLDVPFAAPEQLGGLGQVAR